MCYLRQGVEWIVKSSACIDDINFVDDIKERQKLGGLSGNQRSEN